jgi:hypothetical protein
MMRGTWARGLTKKAWAFGSVAQHRYRRSGRCAEVTQDRVELLTLPIRLDRDAAEKPVCVENLIRVDAATKSAKLQK